MLTFRRQRRNRRGIEPGRQEYAYWHVGNEMMADAIQKVMAEIQLRRTVAGCGQDIAGAEIRDQPTPAIGANGQGMASGQGLDIGVESVRLRHAAEQEEPNMPSWVGIAVPGMSAGAQGLDR